MPNSYYLAVGRERRGPFEIDRLIAEGCTPTSLVWTDGMGDWAPAGVVPELAGLFGGMPVPPPMQPPVPPIPPMPPRPLGYAGPPPLVVAPPSNRVLAGVLGIVLGSLGIHKFVLGYTGAGLIMLLVTVLGSCLTGGLAGAAMHVIGLIEGIIYLTKTDHEFYETYVGRRKEWF